MGKVVERCIDVPPSKAGAKAQRAKGERRPQSKREQKPRRKKGGPQGSHLECKNNGGEVGRPG